MSECVGTLCVDGLKTRGSDDETIDEMLPHLEYMQHIDKIHTQRREAQVALNKAREEIGELETIGAHDSAVRMYHVTMDALHRLAPTEWRDWAIRELSKSFPELAKEKPRGVKLVGRKKR